MLSKYIYSAYEFTKKILWHPIKDDVLDYKNKFYIAALKSYSKIFRKRFIVIIGDSHSKIFINKFPFAAYHIGGATAYNINKSNSSINSKKKIERITKHLNPKHVFLIFSFGEIDCRIHVYRQLIKHPVKTYSEIIDSIINEYIQQLSLYKDKFHISVLGIPPAGKQPNVYNYKNYADYETQKQIKLLFNNRMKNRCLKESINFIDIYSTFAGNDSFIKKQYCDDEVHLNEAAFPQLKRIIINSLPIKH